MSNEEKISLHFNEKVVFQIYSPDESPFFQFNMPQGNGVFRDVLLEKSFSQKVNLSFLFFCIYFLISLLIYSSLFLDFNAIMFS